MASQKEEEEEEEEVDDTVGHRHREKERSPPPIRDRVVYQSNENLRRVRKRKVYK